MMSTRALMERALAISTRWRLPTLSVPTFRRAGPYQRPEVTVYAPTQSS
jgi:hypothetical protein